MNVIVKITGQPRNVLESFRHNLYFWKVMSEHRHVESVIFDISVWNKISEPGTKYTETVDYTHSHLTELKQLYSECKNIYFNYQILDYDKCILDTLSPLHDNVSKKIGMKPEIVRHTVPMLFSHIISKILCRTVKPEEDDLVIFTRTDMLFSATALNKFEGLFFDDQIKISDIKHNLHRSIFTSSLKYEVDKNKVSANDFCFFLSKNTYDKTWGFSLFDIEKNWKDAVIDYSLFLLKQVMAYPDSEKAYEIFSVYDMHYTNINFFSSPWMLTKLNVPYEQRIFFDAEHQLKGCYQLFRNVHDPKEYCLTKDKI